MTTNEMRTWVLKNMQPGRYRLYEATDRCYFYPDGAPGTDDSDELVVVRGSFRGEK